MTPSSSDSLGLVTGATGNTGRGVWRALVQRGVPVRAMVRREADGGSFPAGVQVAVCDFDDPLSLAAALDGAGRVYVVTPSSERAEEQQRRFADLAVRAGAGHLVVLSQLGARTDSPVRFLRHHAAVEEHVRGLGVAYTLLRPNLFFQGTHARLPMPSSAQREPWPQQYQFRVRGPLGQTIRSAFPALRARAEGGDTVLTGVLADQAALYGVLAEAEALGLELIEIRRVRPSGQQDP